MSGRPNSRHELNVNLRESRLNWLWQAGTPPGYASCILAALLDQCLVFPPSSQATPEDPMAEFEKRLACVINADGTIARGYMIERCELQGENRYLIT